MFNDTFVIYHPEYALARRIEYTVDSQCVLDFHEPFWNFAEYTDQFLFSPIMPFFTEYSTGSKNSRLWGLQKERFWMQLNVTSQILMVQLY
mgnify:CR=1 FL=1